MRLTPKATPRFAEKRELILDGAARLFNRRGIKAGTLAEVAQSVGLATNSLTYYYRKKEDLVCACLARSIAALEPVIAAAALHTGLAERVSSLFGGFAVLMADVAERRCAELIFFSDMRALPQPQAAPVFAAYVEMFRQVRRLLRLGPAELGAECGPALGGECGPALGGECRPALGAEGQPASNTDVRRALNARAHLVLSQLLWLRAWLVRYEPSDYPRVAAALSDILLHGLAGPGQVWELAQLALPALPAAADPNGMDGLRDAYLRTATRLINDHGVGGASVERIAATLALTKGSFYHHHDTKHDLIDDCFERSFALIRSLQLQALQRPGNGWQRLLAATVPLVQAQVQAQAQAQAQAQDAQGEGASPPGPLLRLTAWTELPGAQRWQKFSTMNRLGERYAAMIASGMIDGSVRLVDPAVAAQLVCGMINALAEIEHWVPGAGEQPLAALFARPLLLGLLAPPP